MPPVFKMDCRSNEARGPFRRTISLGASLAACCLLGIFGLALPFAGGCASAPRAEDANAADQKAWGTRMARQGFWREALFRYQRADALKPNDPQILSNLAVAHEAIGEPAKALVAYRRALELAPQDPQIKRNYARFAEYYTSSQRVPTGPGAETPPAAPATPPAPAPEKPK